jgi:hypothetical protein
MICKSELSLMRRLLNVALFACLLSAQTPEPRPGTLRHLAAKAKQLGHITIEVNAPTLLTAEIDSLADALREHSVLLVRLRDSFTATDGQSDIVTYYRFRLLQILYRGVSDPSLQPRAGIFDDVQSDEVVVPVLGGTAVVDGVTIKMKSHVVGFETGPDYLIFVTCNPEKHVAELTIGNSGLFQVGPSSELKPLGNPDEPLVKDIRLSYLNSLRLLTERLHAGK